MCVGSDGRGEAADPAQGQQRQYQAESSSDGTGLDPQLEPLVVGIHAMAVVQVGARYRVRVADAPPEQRPLQHARGHGVPDLQPFEPGAFQVGCQVRAMGGQQSQSERRSECERGHASGKETRGGPRQPDCQREHDEPDQRRCLTGQAHAHDQHHDERCRQYGDLPPATPPRRKSQAVARRSASR